MGKGTGVMEESQKVACLGQELPDTSLLKLLVRSSLWKVGPLAAI